MKRKIIFAVVSVLLIVLDQLSKLWAVASLDLTGSQSIMIINKVFELRYLENNGAAFSSFSGKQTFLLVLTSLILVVVIFEFVRTPDSNRYNMLYLAFSLLISGAIGNMIDRFKQGYVVDFLHFFLFEFPTFNVADCYVTVSAVLLAILVLLVYKDEEIAFLFRFKKK